MKTLAAILLLAISGTATLAQTSGSIAKEQANLKLVQDWTRVTFQERQVEAGAAMYLADEYITHNPNVPSGRRLFARQLSALFDQPAGLTYLDARTAGATPIPPDPASPLPPSVVFTKGDFVVMVNYRQARDPADPSKTYRYTTYGATYVQNGKVKEHWDYAHKVKGTPMGGGPDGIDYDTVKFDVTPQEQKNIEVANVWLRNILQYGHTELAATVMAPTYVEHNPNVPGGRDAFVEFFSRIRQPEPLNAGWKNTPLLTIASGPYVFSMFKQLEKDPDDASKTYPTYWFDMVRVENGLIQEHWDSAMKSAPGR